MRITAYEHVGIRVSDRAESLSFYSKLGFSEEVYLPDYPANEMVSSGGVRINLIFNAERRTDSKNILFDDAKKYPGITHPAFVVDDIAAVVALCEREGIALTEGPIDIGDRRRAVFLRDPDGNVLEFDQLL